MFALFRIDEEIKGGKRSQAVEFYQTQPLLDNKKERKGKKGKRVRIMAEGQHQTARKIYSSPSGILKHEFAQLDRQYSYENTVLGRYRLEPSIAEQKAEEGAGPAFLSELAQPTAAEEEQQKAQLSIQSAATKKSVRFQDPNEPSTLPQIDGNHEKLEDLNYYSSNIADDEKPKPYFAQRQIWTGEYLIGMAKKMVKRIRKTFSWKSIRLMLIDWLFLAILGISMALLSMFMDNMIEYLQTFQLVLMSISGNTGNSFLDYVCTYLSWLGYTELLVISSAIFVHYVAPQAVGSGIPEMKTILRGVILKDFLSARTLVSKIVGLTFSLGSGIPVGKMGPFVHVAANTANLLSNVAARVEGAYGNECRKSEMIAAACATGVACCFSAPIGGVLFSIEVTTMYFSVRNYWRGFFAAACGATVFRLLRVVAFQTEVTLVAFYQTHFPQDAFEPEELPFFALIGLFCGLMGAGFIIFYKNVVLFLRQNSYAKKLIQTNWLLYPVIIAFLVATVTYPRGYGRFLSGRYKFTRTVLDFFSNCTWSKGLRHPVNTPHGCSSELLGSWTNHEGYGPYNVFLVLTLFVITFLILSALCNTMPIPCGMFMPMFVVGAAFGRLMGEVIATIFPDGIPGGTDQPIFPGIYAVVGAAALTGAITHSVSVAMICCEITGQLIYIIPLMIAVIIANAVCAYIQPSVYDVMIGIKHLPYLPDIPPSSAEVHSCTAEHIMQSNVRSLCRTTQYKEIRNLLVEMPKLRSFPVVDDPNSMMLLGSISRRTMLEMLDAQIGDETRKKEAERRIRLAIDTIDKHFREAQMEDGKSEFGSATAELNRVGIESDDGSEQRKPSFEEMERRRVFSHGATDLSKLLAIRKDSREEKTARKILSRCAFSESSIAQRNGGERKKSKDFLFGGGPKVYPLDGDGEEEEKRESRFIVEPVMPAKKRSTAASRPARRNAIALTQGKMSDGELSSEASTPPKKSSYPDQMPQGYTHWNSLDHQTSLSRNITEYVRSAKKRLRMIQHKHKDSIENIEYDLHDDERHEWELAQLEVTVEIDEKLIDPAPFQLVRRTSVYKVHSLFSLLDLNRAYVTDRGRLVGVVALRDLRIAIQKAQSGIPLCRDSSESLTTMDSSCGGMVENAGNRENSPMSSAELPTDLDLETGKTCPYKTNEYSGKSPIIFVSDFEDDGEEEEEKQQKTHRPTSLHMIQEENEPKSPKSSPNSSLKRPQNRNRLLSTDSCNQSPVEQSLSGGVSPGEPKDVAQAVAYLRRKSIAVEDLKPLEEIPLPDTENFNNDDKEE